MAKEYRRAPRALCVAMLIVLSCNALAQAPAVRVVSYDVNVVIRSLGEPVEVSLMCELRKPDTLSHLELLFNSLARVQSVQVRTKDGWIGASYEFAGKDTVQLQLPGEAHGLKTLSTKFVYTFPHSSDGDTLLLLDRGHRWYPLIIDQIATFRLTAEVPGNYSVISAGDSLESTASGTRARYVWQSTSPVFKLPLIVFRSDVFKRTCKGHGGSVIALYSYRDDTSENALVLEEADHAFTFFEHLLGRYSFKRLTLFEVRDFDGVNVGSGVLTLGTSSLDQMKKGEFEALHLTIAQQWVGAGIFAAFGRPGFWFLSLSLPHYLRLMYVRQTGGEEAFVNAMQQPLAKYRAFAGSGNDIPIIAVDFPNSREKALVLYAKGPYILSKIHERMGDGKWKGLLQDLYREYRGRILTYNELHDRIADLDTRNASAAFLNALTTHTGMPGE